MPGPKLEILGYETTPIGTLCLRRRRFLRQPDTVVTEITLDHELLMSSLHTASERALANAALERHGGHDLDVMIGGLGLGYTTHEALASDRVARVEVIELLEPVVDWLREGLMPLSAALTADARLTITRGDAYARLAGEPDRAVDLILVDVDHSPDEPLSDASAAFYTTEGLERARRHLSPGGVLATWSYAPSDAFTARLGEVFSSVHVETVTFENVHVGETCTDWLFLATR